VLRPRVRDVLPLPSFVPFSFDRHRLSRSSIRNLTRKNKILDWANAGVKSLNHLGEKGPAEPAPGSKLSAGTRFAQSHILQCYQDVGSPPCTFSPEGALHELLSKSSYYSDVRDDIIPYSKETVSWPERGSRPVSLGSILPEADCDMLSNWKVNMLRDAADYHNHISKSQTHKPYIDPGLMSPHDTYASFSSRLHDVGMVRWRCSSGDKSALGIFFVNKKDSSLRIIFDTRVLNQRFQDPPKTHLPTAAAFSNLESEDGLPLYIAAGDIRNAFYAFEVPEDLSDMFTLPSIPARLSVLLILIMYPYLQTHTSHHAFESSLWAGTGPCISANP
jgi:hypothetical protein